MTGVEVDADQSDDHLVLRWADRRSSGSCRFDRVDAQPGWIGSMDELLDGASRRQEGAVLDAVATWAEAEGITLGLWADDQPVEVLG